MLGSFVDVYKHKGNKIYEHYTLQSNLFYGVECIGIYGQMGSNKRITKEVNDEG